MNILKERGSGHYSIKRIGGFAYLFIALALGIADQLLTDREVNFEVWITIIGTGLVLLGGTLADKLNKFRGIN